MCPLDRGLAGGYGSEGVVTGRHIRVRMGKHGMEGLAPVDVQPDGRIDGRHQGQSSNKQEADQGQGYTQSPTELHRPTLSDLCPQWGRWTLDGHLSIAPTTA